MRIKKYVYLTSVVACLIFAKCASSQTKYEKMKLTAFKLLNFLKEKDSLRIAELLEDKGILLRKKKEIVTDCNFIVKVVEKYGFPTLDKLKNKKDKDGANIVFVNLLNKADSSMNLKKCDLIVYFYPDKLLDETNKLISYSIHVELLTLPSKKIIEAPEIKIE